MPGVAYDATAKLHIHVVSQSAHTFAYRVWFARRSDRNWVRLASGNIETPELAFGPFPLGTKLGYTLLVAGTPHTDWRTQVMLSQRGNLLDCSPSPDLGVANANGVARRDALVVLQ